MNSLFSKLNASVMYSILLLCAPAPAVAETATQTGFVQDVDGEVRINIAGKLRMLSQRIPAAACNLHAGISPEISATALETARVEFQGILNALENGDPAFGVMSAEERFRTVRIIQEIHTKFEPIETALAFRNDNTLSDDVLQVIADQNMDVLGIAKMLVSEISGQYANPAALLKSDAMTIDIAGRQRMLTQKMSKEACQVLSGVNADASLIALSDTMTVFEASLTALQDGLTDVGIQPPPNEEIAMGLAQVKSDWMAVYPLIQSVRDGEQINDAARADLFVGLNITLKNMNSVVGMYASAADLGL